MQKKYALIFLLFMFISLVFSVIIFAKCRFVVKDNVLISVKDGLFQKREDIVSVILPDNITEIGERAFHSCRSLQEITLPDHLTMIGEQAFSLCSSLENIRIPDSVTYIGALAFSGCSSMEYIELPDKITKLQSYTFADCKSLTNIIIPNNIKEIGREVFRGCESLKKIVIPDSVISCGEEVFKGCTNLSDIKMSANIAEIGSDAFKGTAAIRYAEKEANGIIYLDNVLVKGSDSLIRTDVKKGTTVIAADAFKDCSDLQEVKLPQGITGIGKNAFNNCVNLTRINFPDSLTHIGEMAFVNCKIQFAILNNVIHIESEAFAGCSELSDVQLSENIREIGNNVFSDTPWLNQLPLDEYGCRYSGETLLWWEGKTPMLKVKEGTKVICDSLMFRSSSFDADLPDSVSYIGMYFMSGGCILNGRVPDNLVSIGAYGFATFTINTNELVLPNGLETIGMYAFWLSDGFKTVVVPESVKEIGDHAFEDSKDLKTIKVPLHLKDTFVYEGKAKTIYY